ncbi:MAG: VOC family protein [Actinobacteria bacterium]|nr:VOC family protein [Actinomycetota bacterium]
MLADYAPIPTLAVSDLARARGFYEGVLHLTPREDVPEGVMYSAGSSAFLVYPSQFAGTNQGTAMSFQLPASAFDSEVAALRDQGVDFMTFDLPGGTWDEGVASFNGQGKAAWFKDPDGNILNVESMG